MSSKNAEIQAAIDSLDVNLARQLIREAIKDADAETYYLASKVALDDAQKVEFLEKSVAADPFHEAAANALKQLRNKSVAPVNAPPIYVNPVNPLSATSTITQTVESPAPITPVPLSPSRQDAPIQRKRTFLGISRSLATLLIILFFLPWVLYSCYGTSYPSGFDIARLPLDMIENARTNADEGDSQALNGAQLWLLCIQLAALALIPIAGIGILFISFRKRGLLKRSNLVTGIGGLIIIALNTVYIANPNNADRSFMEGLIELLKTFQPALWLTIASLIGLIGVGGAIRREDLEKD